MRTVRCVGCSSSTREHIRASQWATLPGRRAASSSSSSRSRRAARRAPRPRRNRAVVQLTYLTASPGTRRRISRPALILTRVSVSRHNASFRLDCVYFLHARDIHRCFFPLLLSLSRSVVSRQNGLLRPGCRSSCRGEEATCSMNWRTPTCRTRRSFSNGWLRFTTEALPSMVSQTSPLLLHSFN